MKPTIYVDYDSTLNNLVDAWVEHFNSTRNKKITVENITTWDWMEKTFGPEVNDFWKTPKIYEDDLVKPLVGAKEFVSLLQKEYDVSIITWSFPGTEEAKDLHIQRHFGNIEVVHEENKYLVTHDGILIDDRAEAVIAHCKQNQMTGVVFVNKWKYKYASPLNYLGQIKGVSSLIKFRETYADILDAIGEVEIEKYLTK